jgi:hypothetical protein
LRRGNGYINLRANRRLEAARHLWERAMAVADSTVATAPTRGTGLKQFLAAIAFFVAVAAATAIYAQVSAPFAQFLATNELAILRWLHILAMVYWLGGEWGVFQSSYNVINRALPLEERKRHMETAYRIDILARTGIILLLPLGLHMGHIWGIQPFGGGWLVVMWLGFAAWLTLTWSAFFTRETDLGIKLTKIDEALRYVLIPTIIIVALMSLFTGGPLAAEEGQKWYSAKLLVYGLMLCIGLYLRFVMREWTTLFRVLAQGPNAEVEAQLKRSIDFSRYMAYLYWIGISMTAFFGAVKPF